MWQPRALVGFEEQGMKTHLVICNEADYLQAHLTVVMRERRRRNPAFHEFKQWVGSILRKWAVRKAG